MDLCQHHTLGLPPATCCPCNGAWLSWHRGMHHQWDVVCLFPGQGFPMLCKGFLLSPCLSSPTFAERL